MRKQVERYEASEAKKIVADYIDQSALRLEQRLKKAHSEQKKHQTKVRSYA